MANNQLACEIRRIIVKEIEALNRPDLFRKPLIAYSSAQEGRIRTALTSLDFTILWQDNIGIIPVNRPNRNAKAWPRIQTALRRS